MKGSVRSLPLHLAAAILWLTSAPTAVRPLEAQTLAERVQERLRAIPRAAAAPPLARFYERREGRPAWVTDTGPLPGAYDLLASLAAAGAEGLDPADYPLDDIRRALAGSGGVDGLARLELLLSESLLAFSASLVQGRLDPGTVNTIWGAAPTPFDPADLALAIDSAPVAHVLGRLAPPQPGYGRLRAALARYRAIAARGGWPAIPGGGDLSPGVRGPRGGLLRERLALESGEPWDGDSLDRYDDALARAVRRFQVAHGLEADGIVGRATLAAVNVPAVERIREIELNLERWRWLPRDLGESYVMVNSAAYSLEAVHHGRVALRLRAIVGRNDWPTPILSSLITQVVLNPVWDIPNTIALAEVLPAIRRDSTYLTREHIIVFRESGGAIREVDPSSIDWADMTDSTFDVRLAQAPGGSNPLGGVKFIFGNRYGVRIHDTPLRSLFRARMRTFSHGCIRVERAGELAAWVLGDARRWPIDSVRAGMRGLTQQSVPLSQPIPVYVSYWTAWVDGGGTVQFRDDVYGWDSQLSAALGTRGGARRSASQSR